MKFGNKEINFIPPQVGEGLADKHIGYYVNMVAIGIETDDEQECFTQKTPEVIEARSVYARDFPDKELVPIALLDQVRTQLFINEYTDLQLTEEEKARFATVEIEENEVSEVFPWALYAKSTGAYLLSKEDLEKIFMADLTHNYPDRVIQGEQ